MKIVFIENIDLIKHFILHAVVISTACLCFIFPIIFHLSVVPNIEKKIGNKLGYYNVVYHVSLGNKNLLRLFEISSYIIAKSFLKLIGLNPDKIKVLPKYNALQKVNYSYQMFSISEIFWSWLVLAAQLFIFGGAAFVMYLG